MKKKKIVKALLIICAVFSALCLSVGLSACGDNKVSYGDGMTYHTHFFDDWVIVKRPTCTEDGERERYCVCGEKQTSVLASLGHDYIFHEGKPATCNDVGWNEYRTCLQCDYTDYSEIPALGHNYGEWETTKEATCSEKGEEKRVCLRDENHIETRELQTVEHTESEWKISQMPTCTEHGVRNKVCDECGAVILTEEIPELGHSYGEWTQVSAPGCTKEGVEIRVCLYDEEHTETRTTAASGHDYEWSFTAETHSAVCAVCGDKIESLPHEWSDGICSVCGCEEPVLPELAFEISGGNSYTVTGIGTVAQNELEIPSFYNGFPVTAISDYAFENCDFITAVQIPDSVTSIGKGAFRGCINLERIDVPFVGSNSDGSSFTHFGIIFGAESSTENENFVPVSLHTVTINGNVTEIAENAFFDCKNLITVNLPESLEIIGNGAFSRCESLTDILLPEQLTEIGCEAFFSCSQLKNIVIPCNTEVIGTFAFSGCDLLEGIEFANIEGWQIYENDKAIGDISASKLGNPTDALYAVNTYQKYYLKRG